MRALVARQTRAEMIKEGIYFGASGRFRRTNAQCFAKIRRRGADGTDDDAAGARTDEINLAVRQKSIYSAVISLPLDSFGEGAEDLR